MTDMLDGEELYKGGGGKEQGAQAKFLDKYFGYKAEGDGKELYYDKSDRDDVTGMAKEISDSAPRLSLEDAERTEIEIEKPDDLVNTFFALKADGVNYYFLIQEIKGDVVYLSYSQTAFFMVDMLKRSSGTKPKIETPMKIEKQQSGSSDDHEIRATTIKLGSLYSDGKIKLKRAKIAYLVKKESEDGKRSNKNAESVLKGGQETKDIKGFHIVDLSKGAAAGEFKRAKTNSSAVSSSINDFGGFKEISRTPEIGNAKITPA
jgi:hypothetical protein